MNKTESRKNSLSKEKNLEKFCIAYMLDSVALTRVKFISVSHPDASLSGVTLILQSSKALAVNILAAFTELTRMTNETIFEPSKREVQVM
jgi:hypothetical protein